MLSKTVDTVVARLEQQILQEEIKFREALSIDEEFFVLKAIRETIKKLKKELSLRQLQQNKN